MKLLSDLVSFVTRCAYATGLIFIDLACLAVSTLFKVLRNISS